MITCNVFPCSHTHTHTHTHTVPHIPQSKFEVLEAEVKEINANKETLKRNLLDLIELQYILYKTQVFFEEVRGGEGGGKE